MNLYHFKPEEFLRGGHDWFRLMDTRLLVLLDVFRYRWGRKVSISPHAAALGRLLDVAEKSDHNWNRHGAVLAADVMPEGMADQASAERALELATELGFTSIGIYPDWQPAPGLHLGARRECRPGAPALWGAIRSGGRQVYTDVATALRTLPPGPPG